MNKKILLCVLCCISTFICAMQETKDKEKTQEQLCKATKVIYKDLRDIGVDRNALKIVIEILQQIKKEHDEIKAKL